MEWMFLVTASNRPRVESRVLQVLDHHLVTVQSFSSTRTGNEMRISLTLETDKANAVRSRDLLLRLQDVQSVDSFASTDGLCQRLAIFKVLCDQESRLPLLQVVASIGAHVLAVRPEWVAFQFLGTLKDIQGLYESLLPYGLVEAMSVASAVLRKEKSAEVLAHTPEQPFVVPDAPKRVATRKPAPVYEAAMY